MTDRFDAERARSGIDVRHPRAIQREADAEIIVHKDIEHRLPHLVGGRPHALVLRRDEVASTQSAAGDPHSAFHMTMR